MRSSRGHLLEAQWKESKGVDVSINGSFLEIVEFDEGADGLTVFIFDELVVLPSGLVEYVVRLAACSSPDLIGLGAANRRGFHCGSGC